MIPTQSENPEGLHAKYFIQKITKNGLLPVDSGAEYFVLRLDDNEVNKAHLTSCRIAVNAYADSIEPYNDNLANDIRMQWPVYETIKIGDIVQIPKMKLTGKLENIIHNSEFPYIVNVSYCTIAVKLDDITS